MYGHSLLQEIDEELLFVGRDLDADLGLHAPNVADAALDLVLGRPRSTSGFLCVRHGNQTRAVFDGFDDELCLAPRQGLGAEKFELFLYLFFTLFFVVVRC